MSRPLKQGLQYFPIFRYQEQTMISAWRKGKQAFLKYARATSSRFCKQPYVRQYIFIRDRYKCVLCKKKENLQIDHILSIYQATIENLIFLNSEKNLRTLCINCNSKRSPNETT